MPNVADGRDRHRYPRVVSNHRQPGSSSSRTRSNTGTSSISSNSRDQDARDESGRRPEAGRDARKDSSREKRKEPSRMPPRSIGSTASTHSDSSSQYSSANGPRLPRVRFATPSDAQQLWKMASKSGYLRKQADNEAGVWNRYYFIIKPTTYLYYYNSMQDEQPRGIIDLEYLTDVRYNADCVQRSVGGSDHCFRVTGQLPKSQRKKLDKTKLRPIFLDTEHPDDAEEWMNALKTHRYDPHHEEALDQLREELEKKERQLKRMTHEFSEAATRARKTRQAGQALLNRLRGEDATAHMDNFGSSSDLDDNGLDCNLVRILSNLEMIMLDLSEEADEKDQQIAALTRKESELRKQMEVQHRDHEQALQQERNKIKQQVLNAGVANGIVEEEAAKPPPTRFRFMAPKSKPSSTPLNLDNRCDVQDTDHPSIFQQGQSITNDVRGMLQKKTMGLGFMKKKSNSNSSNSSSVATEEPVSEASSSGGSEADVAPKKKTTMFGRMNAMKAQMGKAKTTARSAGQTHYVESPYTNPFGEEEPVERTPRGWTKKESRNHPGEFYYVNDSTGVTSWEVPTQDAIDDDDDDYDDPYAAPPPVTSAYTRSAARAVERSDPEPVVAETKKTTNKTGWKAGSLLKKLPTKKFSRPNFASPKKKAPAPPPPTVAQYDATHDVF